MSAIGLYPLLAQVVDPALRQNERHECDHAVRQHNDRIGRQRVREAQQLRPERGQVRPLASSPRATTWPGVERASRRRRLAMDGQFWGDARNSSRVGASSGAAANGAPGRGFIFGTERKGKGGKWGCILRLVKGGWDFVWHPAHREWKRMKGQSCGYCLTKCN